MYHQHAVIVIAVIGFIRRRAPVDPPLILQIAVAAFAAGASGLTGDRGFRADSLCLGGLLGVSVGSG